MKVCTQCQTQHSGDAKYCTNCGGQLITIQSPAPAPTENVQVPPTHPVEKTPEVTIVPTTAQPSADQKIKYCSNCGAKISKEDLFCEKCGSRQNSEHSIIKTPTIRFDGMIPRIKENLKHIGNTKYFYLFSIIATALLAVLPLFDTYHLEALSLAQEACLFDEATEIGAFSFILFILSAFVSATSISSESKYFPKRFILALCVKALFLFLYFGAYSTMLDHADSGLFVAEVSFTFIGWLVNILSIGSVVTDIKCMLDLSRKNY